jgi:D-sedoheptulose 7-phosphate isomerase
MARRDPEQGGSAGVTEALRSAPDQLLEDLLERRTEANARFFEVEADRIAQLCHRMAERFARGGRLVALGHSPAARSDARHVAVEFVHPVIVGKRALPAIALTRDGGSLVDQVTLLAAPDDIVIGFEADDHATAEALARAAGRGCLTIAFVPAGAEWELEPPSSDEFVRQELIETLYHLLWELVHVFFEHRGLLEGRAAGPVHDTGASSFLYPFLAEGEHDLEAVLSYVGRSVGLKAAEIAALREQTLVDHRDVLVAAAGALRETFSAGGKLLALGNGGSATDAMDAVADFRAPRAGWRNNWRPHPALDLAEDSSILTAIANDIGPEAIFARQVIAYGHAGDALLALSTSGSSRNVIDALIEARNRGLTTIAMVGYDGGRIADEGLADHVVVSRSQHIPRIQEAQATAYHALRELVEQAP